MNGSNRVLKAVLTWVCAGHMVEGLLIISGRKGIQLGSRLYGASFEPSDQFRYIIRAAGAYVLGMAYAQSLAIREPQRYKGVIDATIGVFAMRFFQRVVYRRDIYAAFGMSPAKHWANTAFFNLPGAALLLARLNMEHEPE
jgi:hypothetical protein